MMSESFLEGYPLLKLDVPSSFVASFPKAGRTMVKQYLAQYMNEVFDLGYPEKFDLLELCNICPSEWYIWKSSGWKSPYNLPMVVRFVHYKWNDQFTDYSNIVYLYRNFGDIMASFWAHRQPDMSKRAFIKLFLPKLCDHYKEWTRNVDTVVRYEDLVNEESWRDIVEGVGLDWDEGVHMNARALSEFNFMKSTDTGSNPRVRRGKIKGYTKDFSKSDIALMRDIVDIEGVL